MEAMELEKRITELYQDFFDKFEIDNGSGLVANQNLRFSGFPYIGKDYAKSPRKILFIGQDIGVDELYKKNTFHSIETRRQYIKGNKPYAERENPKRLEPHNPHIAGTYLLTMLLLENLHPEWESITKNLFKNGKYYVKQPGERRKYMKNTVTTSHNPYIHPPQPSPSSTYPK